MGSNTRNHRYSICLRISPRDCKPNLGSIGHSVVEIENTHPRSRFIMGKGPRVIICIRFRVTREDTGSNGILLERSRVGLQYVLIGIEIEQGVREIQGN